MGFVAENITYKSTIDEIANLIHQGWIINYVFWRDNEPWTFEKIKYQKPYKTLNDEQLNICASTHYEDLVEEEKNKDLILAKWIQHKYLTYFYQNYDYDSPVMKNFNVENINYLLYISFAPLF